MDCEQKPWVTEQITRKTNEITKEIHEQYVVRCKEYLMDRGFTLAMLEPGEWFDSFYQRMVDELWLDEYTYRTLQSWSSFSFNGDYNEIMHKDRIIHLAHYHRFNELLTESDKISYNSLKEVPILSYVNEPRTDEADVSYERHYAFRKVTGTQGNKACSMTLCVWTLLKILSSVKCMDLDTTSFDRLNCFIPVHGVYLSKGA